METKIPVDIIANMMVSLYDGLYDAEDEHYEETNAVFNDLKQMNRDIYEETNDGNFNDLTEFEQDFIISSDAAAHLIITDLIVRNEEEATEETIWEYNSEFNKLFWKIYEDNSITFNALYAAMFVNIFDTYKKYTTKSKNN